MAGQGLPNKKRKETAKMALYRESVTKVPSNPFPNSQTAVIIMNGESRQGFDLEKLRHKDLAIFGCNAIYRTFPVDYLVAVDVNMAREINDSGYAHKHEFWSYPRAKVQSPPAIKFPTDWGWSTGPTTVRLAIMKGFKNIYILGMDFTSPNKKIQSKYVNKAIQLVKMGKIKEAERAIRPAVNYLIKIKCKKIILGCTELPIAIFAFKSFQKIKKSKKFLDPNLILASSSMKKYKN